MFPEIDKIRLQLGLCPERLLLLARHSAKRPEIQSIHDMYPTERYDLYEMMRVMLEYGRPITHRCAMAAG